MEKALERALDRAEYVIESARQRPPKCKQSSSGGKSLRDKLYDLYVEECGKEPEVTEELISNVNLLEKLVQRESLSCLVVNLYPGKEGYSLMLKGPSEPHSETIRLPYEERAFLEYLDAEELPPVLVDLLEKSELDIFHSGCVIAEVRDYRQGSNAGPPGYQSRHVLLRPTMQTLACDVQSITSDNQEWTQEDKLELESQLILATAEPLCLDPSVSVACTTNRLLYNRQKMNTPGMRRNFKRYSTPSLNVQQEPSYSLDPHQKSEESQAAQQDNLKIFKAGKCVDMWNQRPCDLAVPSEVDVEKYATEERSVKYDDSPLTVWPAYEINDDISLFGYEAGDQSQTTELTFMQSLGDPLISGQTSPKKARCGSQMSPCHSFKDDHCYSLMPESNIDIGEEVQSLFEELEPLSVEWAFEVSPGSSGSAPQSQLSPEKEEAQPLNMSVQSSVSGEGVQCTPPPISLLSSSGESSSGSDSLTPQPESSFHKSVSPIPAPTPPSLPQKSSVEVNRVSTLPTATLCTASSAQTTPASQVKAKSAGPNFIKLAGPVPAAQTVVRGPNFMKGSTARVRPPVPIKPKVPSSEDQQLPNTQPAVQQASSQGMQFIFKNVSEARPVTLLQLPPGTLILNSQQQSQQQPQQKPQQQEPCKQPQQPQEQPYQQPQQHPHQHQQQPCQQPHQPQQQPQQPQQQPRQQPQKQPQQQPRQQPQKQPQQQPWQPQWQPLHQPGQQPQKQLHQLPLQPRQQPGHQPQQQPRQQVQQQPQQRSQQPRWQQPRWQQPRLQPRLQPRPPQQVPQQQPQQQPWQPQQQPQQPQQQPQQLQQQPWQQTWQQPRQPQQVPQQQPQQQPWQPQQQPQQPQQLRQQPWQQTWQQPRQPQQVPQQQPQQQPWQPQQQPQQPQQLQQQPWQQTWQQPRQPQQVPQQQPQQQPWQPQQQPQQPQQLRQQPWQQTWQQPRQPQQVPQQQPQQQPWQPQQQPLQPQQLQQQPWQQTWQQPQQPQPQPWQQPQQFYQLIPQLQQPIYYIQQSVPQRSSVQRSTHRRMILPAQKTAIAHLKRPRSNLQPQRALGSQPSCTQTRPGQSHPQQRVQPSSAFQQQPQPQQVQLRILQLPVPVPTVATQRAQPHHGQKAASQSKGNILKL